MFATLDSQVRGVLGLLGPRRSRIPRMREIRSCSCRFREAVVSHRVKLGPCTYIISHSRLGACTCTHSGCGIFSHQYTPPWAGHLDPNYHPPSMMTLMHPRHLSFTMVLHSFWMPHLSLPGCAFSLSMRECVGAVVPCARGVGLPGRWCFVHAQSHFSVKDAECPLLSLRTMLQSFASHSLLSLLFLLHPIRSL